MPRHDWEKLKREYLLGEYKNLKEFAEAKQIRYAYLREKGKDWNAEKRAQSEHKTSKIIEKTTEREIEQEVDRNAQHLAAWDRLMWFVNAFEVDCPQSAKTLAEVLEKAQKGQRLALGLDRKEDAKGDSLKAVEIVHTDAELTETEIEELLNHD